MRGIRRSAAERAHLMKAYKASGLSAKAFAARERVPPSTLYQWLADERKAEPALPRIARVVRRPPVPATMTSRSPTAAVVVELGAARLHIAPGFDRTTLSVVLDVLATRAANSTP